MRGTIRGKKERAWSFGTVITGCSKPSTQTMKYEETRTWIPSPNYNDRHKESCLTFCPINSYLEAQFSISLSVKISLQKRKYTWWSVGSMIRRAHLWGHPPPAIDT
jgi:hypothetical protein